MAELKANSRVHGALFLDEGASDPGHAVRSDDERFVQFQDAMASFFDQITVVVDDTGASVTRITTLEAQMADATARITVEETVRATADTAFAQRITTVEASVGDNLARIRTEETARADADSAMASLITTVQAQTDAAQASIITEEIARANADSALALMITTLEATFGSSSATFSDQITALATDVLAVTTRVTTVEATVAGNTASITTETTARATADSALATQITTLSATAGGFTAALTEEATVRANADGTLFARWGITIDINHRISGISLMDGTNQQSVFSVQADVFQVVNPSYPNNTFPTAVILSDTSGTLFSTNLGTGTPRTFKQVAGGALVNRNADLFMLPSLKGVGVGSGFALARVRFAGSNTVLIHVTGQARNITVWYRIVGQFTEWRPFAAIGWLAPENNVENFHSIAGFAQHDLTIGATDTVEIGYNGLNGQADGDTGDDSKNDIYVGAGLVQVVNF
jgi:hypothetical protein